jgi:hypothetical protein
LTKNSGYGKTDLKIFIDLKAESKTRRVDIFLNGMPVLGHG